MEAVLEARQEKFIPQHSSQTENAIISEGFEIRFRLIYGVH